MISATSATQHPGATSILLETTTPSVSSSSFTQQLAAALQQYLGQASSGSNLEIDIQPSQSQNSGASQFLVTVKSAGPAVAATPVVNTAMPSVSPILDTRSAAPINAPAAQPPAKSEDVTGTPLTPLPSSGTTGTPPPGWVSVPFGSGSTVMPALATMLAENNRVNAMMAQINPDSLSTTAAQAGDPLFGTNVEGTSLRWNDLTQNQQLACQYANLAGLPQGVSLTQFLAANVGPSAWWNAPYSNPTLFGAPPAPGSVNMHTNGYVDVNG